MSEPFVQGYLDCLCGVYSIVNADRIVNGSTTAQSQELFNEIICYLSRKRMLKDVVTGGSDHRLMTRLVCDVAGDRLKRLASCGSLEPLGKWWRFAKRFLEAPNRAIILSVGGRISHLTVTDRITQKRIYLQDSNWRAVMKREYCATLENYNEGKLVIYPYQCWYLGNE